MILISGHQAEPPTPPPDAVAGRGYLCCIKNSLDDKVIYDGDMPMVPRVGDFLEMEAPPHGPLYTVKAVVHICPRESGGRVWYLVEVELDEEEQ